MQSKDNRNQDHFGKLNGSFSKVEKLAAIRNSSSYTNEKIGKKLYSNKLELSPHNNKYSSTLSRDGIPRKNGELMTINQTMKVFQNIKQLGN